MVGSEVSPAKPFPSSRPIKIADFALFFFKKRANDAEMSD